MCIGLRPTHSNDNLREILYFRVLHVFYDIVANEFYLVTSKSLLCALAFLNVNGTRNDGSANVITTLL